MKTISVLCMLLLSTGLLAQHNLKPSAEVSGEGVVNVVPDEVTVSVRVENEGKNARELKQQNDRIINNVLAFIKSQGIPDKNVRTEYIRLNKNYDYNTKTYSYAANQSITVKLTDLSKYENLMNGLMESGINRIDGIEFSSSKRAELESEARKKAVMQAKMKAEEYASALNQTIGKAMFIREDNPPAMPQPMYKTAMMMDSESSGGQSMAPGEMEIKVIVYVTFELN